RPREHRPSRHGGSPTPPRGLGAVEGGRTRRRRTDRDARRRPPPGKPERGRPRSRRSKSASRQGTGAGMSATDVPVLPDYAPIPAVALGPALNEQGYHVDRVERNL